ncbi:MAG: hypothetical protein ACXWUG_31360 [Polyangiales bacterium]
MRSVGALSAAALFVASPAIAADHPNVHIEVDACVAVPAGDVKKIVTVELGALVVDTSEGPVTRVRTACKTGLVELVVDDPITGKSLSRSVDILSSPPKARARLLALAIVELVSASWTELESNPKPRVPAAGPKVPESAKKAAKSSLHPQARGRPLRILAIGEERYFFPRTGPLHGFGVRVGDDRFLVGWAADMTYAFGNVSAPIGTISADLVSAGVSGNLHYSSEVLTTRVGPGVRFGSARLSGVPHDDLTVEGRSVRGPWIEPFVHASITLHPFDAKIAFDGGIEAGWVVLPVRANADGERQAAAGGLSVAATLGIGVSL